ncbi:MAG: hypothetical protein KME26_18425 [Oscillatoria princeps RMCB-10]|jgi:hypothetical protein|nr:hypothetical protein [Oscillatoria princeps RMCB-10]
MQLPNLYSRISIGKKTRNVALAGVAWLVLASGGLFAWSKSSTPPQLVAEPALQCDPSWLLTPSPNLDFMRDQLRLFLTNRDPSLCTMQGLLWQEIDKEALRFLGEAAVNLRTKNHKCHNTSLTECLDTIKDNLEAEWQSGVLPSDSVKTIARFLAIELALDAAEGKAQIRGGGEGKALFLQLLEKSRSDRRLAHQQTPDGAAAEYRRQRQLEEEAKKDAEEGFSFSEKEEQK